MCFWEEGLSKILMLVAALTALTGIVELYLQGEIVVNLEIGQDAEVEGQARGIVLAEWIAAAAAEIRHAQTAFEAEPGGLGHSMAGEEGRGIVH